MAFASRRITIQIALGAVLSAASSACSSDSSLVSLLPPGAAGSIQSAGTAGTTAGGNGSAASTGGQGGATMSGAGASGGASSGGGTHVATAGSSGSAGHADAGSDGASGDGAMPAEAKYCDKPMLQVPDDPAAEGPWAVGARTIKIGYLDAAVWYPAKLGSERGVKKLVYDLRDYLPSSQRTSVGATGTIFQPCDCYDALPIDETHGPYPVIVFAHGFSGFKGQSLEFMLHWASRGFVVLAADAPSIGLKTFLNLFSANPDPGVSGSKTPAAGAPTPGAPANCDPRVAGDQTRDLVYMLDSLKMPASDLAFLAGHVDLARVGAAGHSAGAIAVSTMGAYPGVQVVVPMAGGGTCGGTSLKSTLIIGGIKDGIVVFSTQQNGFTSSPAPKRLVGLSNAGHMAETSFCPIGASAGGIINAAKQAGVMFNPIFESFITPLSSDGCGMGALPAERGWEIIDYASSSAFEERLLCLPSRGAQLSAIQSHYPEVGEFKEQL